MHQRRPWLAVVLSLFQPGVGHLYAGSPKRAATAFGGMMLLIALIRVFLLGSFVLLVAALVLAIFAWLAIARDAARCARDAETVDLRWFQRWYVYPTVILVIAFVVAPALRHVSDRLTRYKNFKIPSRGMEDTLLVGDRLVTDMWHFRSREPARGDLVVFRYPVDPSRDFLKRCIAIPGDTIEIRNKQLLLNGAELNEDYVVTRDERPPRNPSDLPLSMRVRDNFGPFTVPPESIFVLGDNRDNSSDSRFWGPVPYELLRGKALYLYWGASIDRIGTKLE